MFTGIVKKISTIKAVKQTPEGLNLSIANPGWCIKAGDSIAVNGVCSTVAKAGKILQFQYMPETISRSTVGLFKTGEAVNLEESLRVSDRFDGHIVMGHVDTIGVVTNIKGEGNSKVFIISPRESKRFMKLVAEKGSVAVDGVSLTVVSVAEKSFTVKIIPYTQENTIFKERTIGSLVNIEFDILAKYISRLCK